MQGSGAHGAYIAGVQHIRKAAHMESPHAGEQHIWRQHTQGSSTYGDDTRRGAAHMGTKHAGEQRIWRRRHTQGSSAYGEDDTRGGAAHMETTHAGEQHIWRQHTQGSGKQEKWCNEGKRGYVWADLLGAGKAGQPQCLSARKRGKPGVAPQHVCTHVHHHILARGIR